MANPEPGWYPDGPGLRWWDGTSWGPRAPDSPPPESPPPGIGGVPPPPPPPSQQPFSPPPPPNPDESDKILAIFAHAGALFGGFVVPLVLYIVARDRKGSLARHHAAEALNFQLTFMFLFLGAMAIGFAIFIAQLNADPDAVPWGIFAIWPLAMIASVANLVLSIIGMVRASNLERWRYPINIRLIGRG